MILVVLSIAAFCRWDPMKGKPVARMATFPLF